ncbi:MAG: type II toxin-antitoxin system HigA family antitoxin [Phycisphaeraceae bacterium JB051]
MEGTAMKTSAKSQRPSALPKTFDGLVKRLCPHVILDEQAYENTIEMMDALTSIPQDKITQGQAEYMQTLGVLVSAYEAEHYSMGDEKLSAGEMLEFLMDQHGMNASDLGRLLGNRALGSKIMRGERELSKANIRTLCEHFNVSSDVFVMAGV